MVRTIWGDPERFKEQYWSRVPGVYFTGDAARRDARRVLLGTRPRGRRDERQRPPAQHDGNRVGAGAASRGRRSCRGRQAARDHGPGGLLLRHAEARASTITASSAKSCGNGWRRRSGRLPGRKRSGSPKRCPRRAAARSCGGCCVRSLHPHRQRRRHHARGHGGGDAACVAA